jgi:coenzyme F420-reducing hydrogenase gamma subunit
MASSERKRLGFFKFTCCSGCGFELLYFQPFLRELLEQFELVFFRLASSGGSPRGPFDIVLVEGAVTEPWQLRELRALRQRTAQLYAVGSCAVLGGISALKALAPELQVQRQVYPRTHRRLSSLRPQPLRAYVALEGELRGCPPQPEGLAEVLLGVLLGRRPSLPSHSVCLECKMGGNVCLLQERSEPCLGPVVNAGCGALCPSANRACYGCFGFMPGANLEALKERFRQMGLPEEEIKRRFSLFEALRA